MKLSGLVLAACVSVVAVSAGANEASVYIDDTFESYAVGPLTEKTPLRRVTQVSVESGKGRVGSGKVARYHDSSTTEGGALEYSVGASAPGQMYIEFDVRNNNPGEAASKEVLIFSVARWDNGRSLSLNANAKRAFSIEFAQSGTYPTLVLREGSYKSGESSYDLTKPHNIKIWVNDHDSNPLEYKRPDTGEVARLAPDSYVAWIDNTLMCYQFAEGSLMQKSVSEGDAVLGRVGFGTPSHGLADFLIDNVRVVDPSGSTKAASAEPKEAATSDDAPMSVPGTTAIAYRKGEDAMNLYVARPEGWSADDQRSALVFFFGGGWTKGSPEKSAGWARWAAERGMVGIAPDYRTKNRFGTSPLESVADARAAFHWVEQNAHRLGIDPARIAVGGSSAGGHVALWTAIEHTPPGSNPSEAPQRKPAVLCLASAVTDTSPDSGYTPQRFGDNAMALSPVDQLDEKMPPVLMFHACDDELVAYKSAVAFHDALQRAGNECELVSAPIGGHVFYAKSPEWKAKTKTKLEAFLLQQGLLPAVSAGDTK